MALDLNYKPNILVNTAGMEEDEWLSWRKKGVGGSDVAAALGLSPYYMSKAEQEFGDRAVAPHAVLPYILDDTIPEERALAMEFGMKLLSMSTRVVVFGSQISSGMDQEIRAAQNLGIPIFYRAGLQESLKCTEVVT